MYFKEVPPLFHKPDPGKSIIYIYSALYLQPEPIWTNMLYHNCFQENDISVAWWNTFFHPVSSIFWWRFAFIFPELLSKDLITSESCIIFFLLACGRMTFAVCNNKTTGKFFSALNSSKIRKGIHMLPKSQEKERGKFYQTKLLYQRRYSIH